MNRFSENISKGELNKLPLRAFEGNIVVIENSKQAKTIIPYLKNQDILGFDTETKPSFKKGVRHKVAVLQLATKDEAFIFRLNENGLLNHIVDILSDDSIVKTGVAIHDDIKALQKKEDFTPKGFIDLQKYVKKFGIKDAGLRKLTGNILGFRISKRERLSNWEKTELSKSQLKYAATDAWVAYEIYEELRNTIGSD